MFKNTWAFQVPTIFLMRSSALATLILGFAQAQLLSIPGIQPPPAAETSVNTKDTEILEKLVLEGNSTVTDLQESMGAIGCWLQVTKRHLGRPVHLCRGDRVRNMGLCYPPCAENATSLGPLCLEVKRLQVKGRGKPERPGCSTNETQEGGLCYEPCPEGYSGGGPFCYEDCPAYKPIRCGLVCMAERRFCTDQMLLITMNSLATLAAIGVSAASIVGIITAGGVLSAVSGIGLAAGGATVSGNLVGLARILAQYPLCVQINETATDTTILMDSLKDQAHAQATQYDLAVQNLCANLPEIMKQDVLNRTAGKH